MQNGKSNPEYAERWKEAYWESAGEGGSSSDMYEAQITVHVSDRMGIVADISMALSEMRVFLLQINTVNVGNDHIIINLKISCKNIDHYRSIVSKIKSIEGVTDVLRGFS